MVDASQRGAEGMTERPGELFSVRGAAIWLQQHGVVAHENTVRHWVKREWLPVRKRPGGGVLVHIADLEHIRQCPLCARR